ncbi:Protein GOLVEN 1 [Linum grandiflorum]
MSSSHVLLLCLVIAVASLSLHACNARHLVTKSPRAHERNSLPESPPESMKMMRGRELMLGSHQTEADVRETNDAEEEEEAVVMDYAQPHRKPPIHNEKP